MEGEMKMMLKKNSNGRRNAEETAEWKKNDWMNVCIREEDRRKILF